MNRLADALRDADLTGRALVKALDRRSQDAPMLSRYCKGVCNPTPAVLADICKVLGKTVEELYDPEDLDYGIKRKAQRDPRIGDRSTIRFCARIAPGMADAIRQQMMEHGIKTLAEWVEVAYEAIKKAPPAGGDRKTANGIYHQKDTITRGIKSR